jgi:hypothetical protein
MIKKFSTYNIVFRQTNQRLTSKEISDMIYDEFDPTKNKGFILAEKGKVLDYLNENFTGWIKIMDLDKEMTPDVGEWAPYPAVKDPDEEFENVVSYDSFYIGIKDFAINYTVDAKSVIFSRGRKTYNFKPRTTQYWIKISGELKDIVMIKLNEVDLEEIKEFDPYGEEDWSDTDI